MTDCLCLVNHGWGWICAVASAENSGRVPWSSVISRLGGLRGIAKTAGQMLAAQGHIANPRPELSSTHYSMILAHFSTVQKAREAYA